MPQLEMKQFSKQLITILRTPMHEMSYGSIYYCIKIIAQTARLRFFLFFLWFAESVYFFSFLVCILAFFEETVYNKQPQNTDRNQQQSKNRPSCLGLTGQGNATAHTPFLVSTIKSHYLKLS